MKESTQLPQDLVILADGTLIDPNLIYSNPGEKRVGLFTEFPQISVAPGKSTTISVVVLNQGQTADGFLLSVDGVPTSWLESLPAVLQLAPGGSEWVTSRTCRFLRKHTTFRQMKKEAQTCHPPSTGISPSATSVQ